MRILRTVADPHLIYHEAFEHLTIAGHPPGIVTARLKSVTSDFYPIRVIVVILSALALVLDIYLTRLRHKTVLVREFWNVPLLATAPLLWPVRRSVYYNINHNLTGDNRILPRPIALLARAGFRFVLLDGEICKPDFPPALREVFYTPLFPSVAAPKGRASPGHPPRLGLAGDLVKLAAEDGALFDQLDALSRDGVVQLCFGKRDIVPDRVQRMENVQIIDTASREDFGAYLASIDIILFVADPVTHYRRHSGTVMDAVSAGVIPLVPDFPVFRSQVRNPCPVGDTYASYDSLPATINAMVATLDAFAQNRPDWHRAREKCAISPIEAGARPT